MANPVDDRGNVRVDHVWGNIPMQPNDARGENVLDYSLDNHEIVETGRYGYPSYDPTWIGDGDDVPNVVVPNVVGLTEAAATTALTGAGLVKGAVTTTGVGATVANDGLVKTQTPVADADANQGDSVALVKFLAPTVPDVVGDDESTAEAALIAAGFVKGAVTTSADGATAENDGLVKTQNPASGTKGNTGGSVDLVLYAFEG